MATWEEILNPITQNRVNATRPQATTPAVTRRSDVFNRAFENVERAGAVKSPGGWQGLVQGVLSSPIGTALTKVGEAVSLPGRAVTSGLQEVVDIFDNNPETKASWDDFTKQVADPTFGFGRIIGDVTGNKWGDRLLGLAGDILLDPTTYLTLGSTKALKILDDAGDVVTGMKGLSVASADGRIALAKRVLETTGDKALAAKVSRYGRAAIKDPTVFERIGLDRAGLYFMGKRMPGTTRVGEAVERGFATMRTWSGDHMFKRSNELFTLADANAARRMLLRGQAGPEDASDYLYAVISSNQQRAAKGSAGRVAGASLQQIVDQFGLPQLNEMGLVARRAIESGTIDELEGLPRDLALAVDGWFKTRWAEVEEATKAVDPLAPLGQIENYIPMMATERAIRDMARAYDSRFTNLKEYVYNPLDSAGSFRTRMQEGDDFFGYTLTKDDVGNIERMNQIAREYGKIDYDFFETDLPSIMTRYIDQYSDQMGIVARKKYLVDKGVFQKLEEKYFIDEDAWKQARKAVTQTTKARAKAASDASATLDTVINQIDSLLRGQLDQFDAAGVNLTARSVLKDSADAKQAKHLAKVALRDAYQYLAEQRGTLYALVGERPPQVVRIIEEKLERVVSQIERVQGEIDNLTDNGVDFAVGKIRALRQEIADVEEKSRMLEEFGNLVESQLDDIIVGKSVPGMEKISEAIRSSFELSSVVPGGRKALISGKPPTPTKDTSALYNRLKNQIKGAPHGGAPGAWTPEKQNMLNQRFRAMGGILEPATPGAVDTEWWKNANQVAEITPTAVVNMTAENVADVVSKAMRGEASVREMRTAMLSIASRNVAHPSELWTAVFGSGVDGSGVMARAAQAEAFFKSIEQLGKNRAKFTRLATVKSNLDTTMESVTKDLSAYAAADGLLNRIFADTFDEFDERAIVPAGMLGDFLAQPEFAALRPLFKDYVDDGVDDIVTEAWSVARNIEAEDIQGMRVGRGRIEENGVEFTSASGLRDVERSLPDLTFGEFSRILRGVVDEIDGNRVRYQVTFSPTGPIANLRQGAGAAVERVIEVNVGDYTDEIHFMVRNGEEWPAISARIEEMVYGAPPVPRAEKTVKGVARVQKYRGPEGVVDSLASLREELAAIKKDMNDSFPGFVDADSVRVLNQKGEVSSVSFELDIAGQKKRLSQRAAEDAKSELAEAMLEFWFRSEVEERFARAIELLQPFGMVPTMDYHRRIVNQVAKRAGVDVASDIENLSAASTAIGRMIMDITENPRSWVGREDELFRRITTSIGDYGDILRRYGGRADASNIYRQWTQLGGIAPANTGIPKKINEARRVLSNPASTPEQKLEAQSFLNASRSMQAIKEERDNFYDNVVVKWFESSYGYKPSNRTEANNALREMSTFHAGYGRIAEDAGYEQQLKWLKTVQAGLDEAARKLRKNRGWVVQASDPFLDYSKLRIGRGVNPMDLPHSYYYTLRNHADKWDQQAAILKARTDEAMDVSSELSRARGPQAAAQAASEAFGRPRASLQGMSEITGLPTRELEDARRIYLRASEMRSSLEYMAAIEREGLHDLLSELSLFDIRPDSPMPMFRGSLKNAQDIINSGENIYTRTYGNVKRGHKRVRNVGELTDDVTYYTFVPQDGFPTIASVDRLEDRIKSLRKEIAATKKDIDRNAGSIDDWYASEKKLLDKKDIYAKRDLDAELRNRRAEISRRRLEVEQKQATVAQLAQSYENAWKVVTSTYRGSISHRFMKDGQMVEIPLKFTKAEYDSLFMSPSQMAGTAGAITKKVDAIDDAIVAETKLVEDLTNRIMYKEPRRANAKPRLMQQRNEANARIQTLMAEREKLVDQRNSMRPEVQQVALEKARIIYQQIKSGAVSKDEMLRGMRTNGKGVAPEVAERRAKTLNNAWSASAEKKFLDDYRILENSIQYEIASSAVETAGSAIRYAEELRAKADEAWGMYADDDAPWGFIERAGERVPRGEPVLGVAGIHRRLTETDKELREALAGISKATGNQIDAVAKFEQLYAEGMKTRDIIDQIINESKLLRPEDTVFIRNAEVAKLIAQRESLADEIGFWESFGRDASARLWGGEGSVMDMKRGVLFPLQREAERLRGELDKFLPDWAKSQAELIDIARADYDQAQRRLLKAEDAYTKASIAFDQAQLSKVRLRNWYPTVIGPMRESRSRIVNRLDELAKISANRKDGDFKMAELLDWLDEFDGELGDLVGMENFDDLKRLRADALAANERLILAGDAVRDATDVFRAIENLEWGTIVEREARKGWKSLASSGLPSFQARREIAQIVENFSRIQQPAFVRSLNKFIGSYTGFFKAYATATPGFIVRNTITNAFVITAAGADPRAMSEGLRIFREWNQALKSNSSDAWLNSLPKAKRQMVEQTIAAMDASGYGRVGEAFSMWRPNRKWLVDNRYIGTFRSANKVAEDSARFILAWDSTARGLDFDTSVARIKRYLFDYQNVSAADEVMRSIIPFWFWMSRNLPLQLTNQWINPKAYAMYSKFKNAISSDEEEDPLLPSWMREAGAISLGGSWYATPELGFQGVQRQLEELGQPKRLLSYVNPALRLPVELLGGRKLYNDTPFGTRGQEAMGGPLSAPVQALAEILGQGAMTSEGAMGVTPKFNYAIRNLIPPLAQAERLVPSSEYGQQAQLSSILGYLGVPLREVTPLQRETEARRQREEQQRGQ